MPTLLPARLYGALSLLVFGALAAMPARGQHEMRGEVGLACEALLCLQGAGFSYSACRPSLERYFSINLKYWSDTLTARRGFLSLCPTSNEVPGLADALVNGAGRCDAQTLNSSLLITWGGDIGNDPQIAATLPVHCRAYYQIPGLSAQAPVYVGTPEAGGRWIAPDQVNSAVEKYNSRPKQADEAGNTNDYWWR